MDWNCIKHKADGLSMTEDARQLHKDLIIIDLTPIRREWSKDIQVMIEIGSGRNELV